jgi:hypothetical protein
MISVKSGATFVKIRSNGILPSFTARTMSVHYKFKSAKNFDTITFEGAVISVAELKREIIKQQKLSKANDFDLEITNAQTHEGNHSPII